MTDPIAILRRELVAAARREAARAHTGSHAWPTWRFARRGRPALVLVVALVLASGTAVAASQLFGPPVRAGLVLTGGPKPGQVVLAPLRVADPAGGYSWGVRVYTPKRGAPGDGSRLSCLQIGRVLDGRLGVIGEDGAFGNDGLFHVLPVEPRAGCTYAPAGSYYVAYVPTSAFAGLGSCVTPTVGVRPGTALTRLARGSRACPIGDLRLVVYGIATPRATTVRLASASGVKSERLVSADRGAFIFVVNAAGVDASRQRFRVTFGH